MSCAAGTSNVNAVPFERLGTPADVAEVVAFLTSQPATGSTDKRSGSTAVSTDRKFFPSQRAALTRAARPISMSSLTREEPRQRNLRRSRYVAILRSAAGIERDRSRPRNVVGSTADRRVADLITATPDQKSLVHLSHLSRWRPGISLATPTPQIQHVTRNRGMDDVG